MNETNNPQQWHVQVIGPDDLIPVRNHVEAVNLAHRLNTQIRDAFNLEGFDGLPPYSWAVPVPPSNTAALVVKE